MSNYKRKKSKNQRAGCLMCKPWKINGNHNGWEKQDTHADELRKESMKEELEEFDETKTQNESP